MSKTLWRLLIIILVIVVLGGTFAVGVYAGFTNQPAVNRITSLVNKESVQAETVDFAPFWEAWEIVDQKFVNGNSTSTASSSEQTSSNQDRVWGAIAGMVDSLGDPYSVFLPPQQTTNFQEEIKGNFGGIGIEIGMRNGLPTVIAPLPSTPAKAVGMKSGDAIIAINGEPSTNIGLDEIVTLIRGQVGSAVDLTVFREGEEEPLEFTVTRAVITIPTIETELLPEKVFVIRLFNFSASAPDLFRQALREFTQSGTDKLVLDLRGNPGGYLEVAVNIASWFLPLDEVVAIESRGEDQEPRLYKSYGYDVFSDKLKMVVLIDRGSASASEILAGALSEHGRAVLVGEKSFGKGSVQELVPVTDNTSLKITIARWLTPHGVSISHEGLTPSVEVNLDEEVEKDQDEEVDLFMDKAVEILTKDN